MTCECQGLNQISSLPVPNTNGQLGARLDVSAMAADKTVEISGTYQGSYTVYGSHDGSLYVPLLTFDAGVGTQQLKRKTSITAKYLAVKRQGSAQGAVTMAVSAQAACICSGATVANQFLPLGSFSTTSQTGPLAAIDLWTLTPNTGLQSGFNVMCAGPFEGLIAIEGSLDGVHFVPLGVGEDGSPVAGFQVGIQPRTPGTSFNTQELSPIIVPDVVRYLRANLKLGSAFGTVSLTVGGKQNCDCPSDAAGCTTQVGPTVFNETDSTIINNLVNPTLVKSIPINFAALPSGPYGLRLVFDAGQMQVDEAHGGYLWIVVGSTAAGFGQPDDYTIWEWSAASITNALAWTSIATIFQATGPDFGYFPLDFTNPVPAGTGYIKIFASGATAGTLEAGIRNYTLRVTTPSDPLWGPTTFNETVTTVAHAVSVVKSIPIDFSTFPTEFDRLRLICTGGQIQGSPTFGLLSIIIGGGANDLVGNTIWEPTDIPGAWEDFTTFDAAVEAGSPDFFTHFLDFTNPNIAGISYLKLCAEGDPGVPTGWRNFTFLIRPSKCD